MSKKQNLNIGHMPTNKSVSYLDALNAAKSALKRNTKQI